MDSSRIVLPTCEISMDPETAIEGAASWGILSPGLFIRDEAATAAAERALSDRLPRSLDLAHELGAEIMIIFSFRQTAGVPEAWVVQHLRTVAEAAAGSGLTLVIEPLAGTYADSGAALSRMVRAVDHPDLRVNWDPGNVARAGYRAFPDEYAHVRDLLRYVHLKNYASASGQWTVFDQGDIDLPAQLQALRADGYDGYLCIETHTRYNRDGGGLPPIAASKANQVTLQRWLKEIEVR
jgi:sugar phosphate isomerase/epimerase